MLDSIKQPIKSELEVFDKAFRDAMKSRVPLLDKISYYIVKSKGKQFRPLIALLSAKMFGPINDRSYISATLVELLHTATLVHDDVVDESHMRRGFFSINALWKNKIAVLVGDYLLSRGLILALENKHFDLLEILSTSVKEMAEGELLQIEKARRLDIDETIYFQIIKQKTASLIASATCCGTKSTCSDPMLVEKMRLFGENLGIAFQIKDDLMDLSEEEIGKPLINDIKEKKMTLPLIYALKQAPSNEKNEIIKNIRNDSENKNVITATVAFIKKYKGIPYAKQKMQEYHDLALQHIEDIPDSECKQAMIQLCHFVIERKK